MYSPRNKDDVNPGPHMWVRVGEKVRNTITIPLLFNLFCTIPLVINYVAKMFKVCDIFNFIIVDFLF